MFNHALRLNLTVTLIAALVSLSISATATSAEISVGPDVGTLIQQLGADSFEDRQIAEQSLRNRGSAVLPALSVFRQDKDLERRHRVIRLIAEIKRLDHRQKLKQFESNPQSAADALLPDLGRYREVIGSEKPSNRLFVEMQLAEPELFIAFQSNPGSIAEKFEKSFAKLRANYTKPTGKFQLVESICALMWIGSNPDVQVSTDTLSAVSNFAQYKEFRTAIQRGGRVTTIRKIAGAWIARPVAAAATQRITLAMRYDLPEGIIPAILVLQEPVPGSSLPYAYLAVAKFGGLEHIGLLEEGLDKTMPVANTLQKDSPLYRVETCDMALLAILHLTGEEPRDYGYKRLKRHSLYGYSYVSAGFLSPDDRQQAHQLWLSRRPELLNR